MLNIKDYIGNMVNVKIDRPMNSKHPKHGFVYPVNYGFVPNTISGDREELDCYVLGLDKPVHSFYGRCIAVIHRTNDNDDKLIIVPDGVKYSNDEIRKLTNFQEQYFESEIIRGDVGMKEKSCGCIIIDNDKVLLIKQTKGHWSVPKGHVEGDETEVETALRETKEETNLDVEIDTSKRYTIEYVNDYGNLKEVVLFVAKPISSDAIPQEAEVSEIKWIGFEDAIETISYDNSKELLRKVLTDLGKI